MSKEQLIKLKARAQTLAPVRSKQIHVPVKRDELLWLLEHAQDFNDAEREDH